VGAVSDAAVRVLDAATGAERSRCPNLGEPDQITNFSWSPDGTRIAVGHGVGFFSFSSGGVRIFDAATGVQQSRPELGTWVNATCWSPDGRLVGAGGGDGGAVLVEAATGALRLRLIEPVGGLGAQVEDVQFDRNGRRVVSAGRDGAVRVFDAATGAPLSHFDYGHQAYHALFSPDGRWIASSGSGGAVLFDAVTGVERCRLFRNSAGPVLFSPDGSRVSVGTYLRARIFDPAVPQARLSVPHDGPINAVATSPDGRWIATGCADGAARVLDARTGAERCRLTHDGPVRSLAFAPDGRWVATGSEDATARVFDAATGIQRARFAHGGTVLTVVTSRDGTMLATGSDDGAVRVFDCRADAALPPCARRGGAQRGDQPGRRPAGHRLRRRHHPGVHRTIRCRTGAVRPRRAGALGVLHPDGSALATACADGFARLFDLGTGAERLRLGVLDRIRPSSRIAHTVAGETLRPRPAISPAMRR
jgi:WD40 repeat protein